MFWNLLKFDIKRSLRELILYSSMGIITLLLVLAVLLSLPEHTDPKVNTITTDSEETVEYLSTIAPGSGYTYSFDRESDSNIYVSKNNNKYELYYQKADPLKALEAIGVDTKYIDSNNAEWVIKEHVNSKKSDEGKISLAVFIWSLILVIIATPIAFINKLVVDEIKQNQLQELIAFPYPPHLYILQKLVALLTIGLILAIVSGTSLTIGAITVISILVWTKLGNTITTEGMTINEQYGWSSSTDVFMGLSSSIIEFNWLYISLAVLIVMCLFICCFVLVNTIFSEKQALVKLGERLIFLLIISPVPLFSYGATDEYSAVYTPMYNLFCCIAQELQGVDAPWGPAILTNSIFISVLLFAGSWYIKRFNYYKT